MIGLAQTDRLSRSMVLHFLEELILHLGKRFEAHSLRVYTLTRLEGCLPACVVLSLEPHYHRSPPRRASRHLTEIRGRRAPVPETSIDLTVELVPITTTTHLLVRRMKYWRDLARCLLMNVRVPTWRARKNFWRSANDIQIWQSDLGSARPVFFESRGPDRRQMSAMA